MPVPAPTANSADPEVEPPVKPSPASTAVISPPLASVPSPLSSI